MTKEEMIEKENELYALGISDKEVIGIDNKGNIAKRRLPVKAVALMEKGLTNYYIYLEWIDIDTFIFGELSFDKYGFDYNDTMVEKEKK